MYILSEGEDPGPTEVEGPCFDPDYPSPASRPRRSRRRRPAARHRSPLDGMPAWYREAFLAHDPKNPGEFVARVLTALADELHGDSGPDAPFPP